MKLKRYKDLLIEKNIHATMSLPTDIDKIAELFHQNGKDLFVVGGAVRDFLQGKKPHDYDLVTNALPEESKKILNGWDVSDEQGKNFGVLRIYTKDEPLGYELAVYRKDISSGRDTKGDDQKVEIGKHITIEDDVLRRDLTINSLFYDINKKEIVDLVGGVDDIKNNIIRAVGIPSERFNEDRLRILRAIRFAARTGGEIDSETSDAIKKDNRLKGIGPKDDVSQERIIEEWNKTMEHAKKSGVNIMQKYVNLLFEYNMFEQMFPGLKHVKKITVDVLENSIIFIDLFAPEIIKTAKSKLNNLKFNNNLINQMIFLQEFSFNDNDIDGVYNLALLKQKYNIDNILIAQYVEHINNTFGKDSFDEKFTSSFLKYCDDGFEVKGDDLIKKGFKGYQIQLEKERLENERFRNKYY